MPNKSMISDPSLSVARPGVTTLDRPDPIIEFVAHRISEPARFPVQKGLIQLNNGSYGCCPEVVGTAQRELQRRLEADPVRFFKSDLEFYSDDTRAALGKFVNVRAEDLVLVSNGTFAVATVLNNLELSPGDEILVTDHEYAATMNELGKICRATGAKVVIAKVQFPAVTPEMAIDSVVGAMTERTKLVMVSHIASASALVLPVKEIVAEANERGILSFIDGAHTPGQIALDIGDIDPTWYAASCHKWLATPKGTGFIYSSPTHQDGFKPMVLSCREHEKRDDRKAYLCDFDYVGTNDYTGNLVVPVAIEHMGSQLPGGWDELRQRNHDLVVHGSKLICDAIGIEQVVPESMIGTMVGIPLPGVCEPGSLMGEGLWDRLYLNHGIQVPIWDLPGVHARVMRVSGQLFNTIGDFEVLAGAMKTELK
ncbi:MAG: aminotransferase class V-fold PLP-dependent enzyme [Phycisphaerales bacterium]|nr:aminotransferase class V-fold PLP-dependent enzyme [Phycisphaerales bacterium]